MIKIGDKFDCESCKTSLSQHSMDQHLKMHLENGNGKDKDNIISKDLRSSFTDTSGYCDICKTRFDNKNQHHESNQHKENDKEKKLVDDNWRDKVNELGLDHNMKHNQIKISSSEYEDSRFLQCTTYTPILSLTPLL